MSHYTLLHEQMQLDIVLWKGKNAPTAISSPLKEAHWINVYVCLDQQRPLQGSKSLKSTEV